MLSIFAGSDAVNALKRPGKCFVGGKSVIKSNVQHTFLAVPHLFQGEGQLPVPYICLLYTSTGQAAKQAAINQAVANRQAAPRQKAANEVPTKKDIVDQGPSKQASADQASSKQTAVRTPSNQRCV